MKKTIVAVLVITGLVAGASAPVFASDWDKAGKALAVIEGLRIITGGRADVIGTVTGINRPREQARPHDNGIGYAYGRRKKDDRSRYAYDCRNTVRECERRVWVPHYVWREKFVPEHTEYRPGYGNVVIEAHYERYQVEDGGHWEYAR